MYHSHRIQRRCFTKLVEFVFVKHILKQHLVEFVFVKHILKQRLVEFVFVKHILKLKNIFPLSFSPDYFSFTQLNI